MSASPLETSWTAIAVLGLLFSLWLAGGGWLDWRAVEASIRAVPPRARRWGPRWWVALSAVVANGLLCLVWIGFAFVGLIAMQYPPPPRTAHQTTSTAWIGWLLIAMELLLAFVQAWHLMVRGRVEQTARSRT